MVTEQELLNPDEQDGVLQDIALVLAHNLPAGWQECVVVHSALGDYAETSIRIERLNGPPTAVEGPPVLAELLARLRAGMYRPGVGAWFSARYQLTHPVEYQVQYDITGEPGWSTPPPRQAYEDELRRYPRDPEHIPDWLRAPAGDQAADGAPAFRMARLFDALGPGQTPQVDRPPVPDEEVEQVADYLTKAPMVLAARSLDADLFDPARPAKVPLTYLTDGTWIWPGGVGYYLRTHSVPPEPDLVEHIRSRGFQPGEIDDYTRDAAVASIMGQPPPPRPGSPAAESTPPEPPASEPPAAEPVAPEPAAPEPAAPESPVAEPMAAAPEPLAPEPLAPETPVAEPVAAEPAAPEVVRAEAVPEEAVREEAPAVPPLPQPEPEPEPAVAGEPLTDGDRQALDRLRARLSEVGAAPESYSIEAVVDGAWCLMREGGGWAVFRAEGDGRGPGATFPDVDQAAAYLLGSLLLVRRPAPAEGPVTQPDIAAPASPVRTYAGPIEPMSGEPPLSLFRNVRELELVAGTEIDRFGDPVGNLAYAAGTHYSQRSLPPEWADRPYHAYRLTQPLRVLIGTAVPWFDQPGGGSGYFLPAAVVELVADGVLVEIEPTSKVV